MLQSEALLGIGAALAAHPHEAIAALNQSSSSSGSGSSSGSSGSGKRLMTEALTAVLALDDVGGDDDSEGGLRLAWARAECALALLQELLPVVQATHHVQGLLRASSSSAPSSLSAAQPASKGFPWSSSSSTSTIATPSGGGCQASMPSSSSLTVHDLGAVLLEGLVRGVARVEGLDQQGQQGRRSVGGVEAARYDGGWRRVARLSGQR
jgi:hypothetical protein